MSLGARIDVKNAEWKRGAWVIMRHSDLAYLTRSGWGHEDVVKFATERDALSHIDNHLLDLKETVPMSPLFKL